MEPNDITTLQEAKKLLDDYAKLLELVGNNVMSSYCGRIADRLNEIAERHKIEEDKLKGLLKQFIYYGQLYTVDGVRPAEFLSHKELIKEAQNQTK